jgi:CheY-like chemotaxis protein
MCVDDEPVVRRGIAAMLRTVPELNLIAEAASGDEVSIERTRCRSDGSATRGEMDGIETIEKLCRERPAVRILVLTTYAGDENINGALEAGAEAISSRTRWTTACRSHRNRAGPPLRPPEVTVQLTEHGPRVDLTDHERGIDPALPWAPKTKKSPPTSGSAKQSRARNVEILLPSSERAGPKQSSPRSGLHPHRVIRTGYAAACFCLRARSRGRIQKYPTRATAAAINTNPASPMKIEESPE